MKKIYLLGLALTMMSVAAKAQTTVIDDNFESYPVGSLYGGHWNNWAQQGADEAMDITVNDRRSSSPSKSGYIGPHNLNNGQDALLLMPAVYTKGKVTMEWKMYVPKDSVAYYNIQETATPGEGWAFECYINTGIVDDTFSNGETQANKLIWTYTLNGTSNFFGYGAMQPDTWYTLKQVMDLDNHKLNIFVNDVEILYSADNLDAWPGEGNSIGAVDFFSFSDTANLNQVNTYYVDDIKVTTENVSGINNVEKSSNLVSLYPNPSNDRITIFIKDEKITNIELFNISGQMVLNEQPKNASLAELNIQKLATGVYTAKVRTQKGIYTKEFVVK